MSTTLDAGLGPGSTTTPMLDPNSTLANNMTTTAAPERAISDFWIGLILAVSSSLFIGSSFILQKLGLMSMGKKEGNTRASEGGHRYLLEWKWWIGMGLMILGEVCNFVAFTFAPATLVTPLGALSVIFSAILASYFLKERLNLLGKLGCLLCILGSTVMVIHSPKNSEIKTMEELLHKVQQPAILTLVGVFIIAAIIWIVFLAPRWGQTNVVVYVFICSTLGALTVTGAKGMGVALKQTFEGEQQFTNWLTYVMLAVVAVNILFQINFLNKALDTFNTAVVTPTYYVLFNSAVAIVTLTLFQEFNQLTVYDIIGEIIGFFVIVVGIFVLNAFKDMDISLRNLPKAKKAGQEIDINDGTKMPVLKRDNDLVLEIRENESEDENDSLLLECHDSPVYVDDDHLEIGEVAFKMPKHFFSNEHLKANGHVNKLDIEDDKHFNNEVTHF